MNITIIICVLIYELILITGVGFWVAKQNKLQTQAHNAEFTHGGRQLGVTVIAGNTGANRVGRPSYYGHIRTILDHGRNVAMVLHCPCHFAGYCLFEYRIMDAPHRCNLGTGIT